MLWRWRGVPQGEVAKPLGGCLPQRPPPPLTPVILLGGHEEEERLQRRVAIMQTGQPSDVAVEHRHHRAHADAQTS